MKYKVDRKLFDQRILEEQLRQVELQSKYLKDEPLKRSEVDDYNKLKANGWVKNTLVSLGVLFATGVAFIIFILLGNMLITNGRSGNVGKYDIDSSALFEEFKKDGGLPTGTPADNDNKHYLIITYEVPNREWIDDKNTSDISDDESIPFLTDPNHDVYVIYEFSWNAQTEKWSEKKDAYGTIGMLSLTGDDNNNYALDVRTVNLNKLMTDWFMGQEDGWAKTLIRDFFFTAWPLTLVFWLVFILAIVGYAVVLVVGIRYVIRTVISVLKKAGYIASEFVTEVVDTFKSEMPIVEVDKAKELNINEMREMLSNRLEESKLSLAKNTEIVVGTGPELENQKLSIAPVSEENTKKPLVARNEEAVSEKKEKTAKDKMNDIFNQ
jgi:hypothetical protein